MPTAPLRPCTQPGCPTLVARGRCPAHARAQEQARGTRSARGYTYTWFTIRAHVLAEEDSCRACGADGQANDHVDHIHPLKLGGSNDRDNLQRLCHRCHSRKTLRENRSARR